MQSSKKYRTHTTRPGPHKKNHRANQKKIDFFFSLKWALRDSFLPAWGVCNLSWGCCRYSSPGLSLFKMQTLRAQPLAAQQGICYSPRSLWGKRFVPLFLLFTEGTVCSGHFSWLRKYWWRNDSGFKAGCGWEGLLGTCISGWILGALQNSAP